MPGVCRGVVGTCPSEAVPSAARGPNGELPRRLTADAFRDESLSTFHFAHLDDHKLSLPSISQQQTRARATSGTQGWNLPGLL